MRVVYIQKTVYNVSLPLQLFLGCTSPNYPWKVLRAELFSGNICVQVDRVQGPQDLLCGAAELDPQNNNPSC